MATSRPVLAVVTAQPVGDGVGYTGLLLARALEEIAGTAPSVVAVDPGAPGRITRVEQLAFLCRLTMAQRMAPPCPVVFNHVGIARAQLRVPALFRRPYAVFLHGVEVWDPGLSAGRKAAIRAATIRLSNSQFTARRVEEVNPGLGPINPCPLALLPDCLPSTRVETAEAEGFVGAEQRPRVVIVGRMSSAERYKGHDELIECWPRVRAMLPAARLYVVGKGDDTHRLQAKAVAAGVADAITFTGFLADSVMRALLVRCNVFAMPSRGEGFGLAYLEAMRCGLPCIGGDSDAAHDVIVDGETGRIVRTGDLDALAASLIDLLRDPERARAMGLAGRRREENTFSFEAFRDHLAAALGPVPA